MSSLVVITWLAFVSSRASATCKQPSGYPTEIPLIGCPTSTEPQLFCLRCLEGQVSFRIFYDDGANVVADAWRPALENAGWKLEQKTITDDGVRTFSFAKGNRRLHFNVYIGGTDQWKPVTPKLKGTLVFATFYTWRG